MNRKLSSGSPLFDIYHILYNFYGPQGWWPAKSRLEVIVGAILTQNTAWVNVEKAISNLRFAHATRSFASLKRLKDRDLARYIRPAGYYNIKAKRLRNFINFLDKRYGGSLCAVSKTDTDALRGEFLAVNGIGPETCDSILLYALKKRVFVVDAYTKRIFSRHDFFGEDSPYGDVQKLFVSELPQDEKIYNEYHALIVRLGKEFCRKTPKCGTCPLRGIK